MIRPVPLRALLSADQEVLADVVEQVGKLLAKVVLLQLTVRRLPGDRELTLSRLSHLATDLHEAAQDAQAAIAAWQTNR